MTKNCKHCTTPFDAKRSTALFCSDKCKVANNRGTETKTTSNQPVTSQPPVLITKEPYTDILAQAITIYGKDHVDTFITRKLEWLVINR